LVKTGIPPGDNVGRDVPGSKVMRALPRAFACYAALALSATLAAIGAAHAQPYPSKLIRIVVPMAPGGGSDLLARSLAQRLTESMKQSVIVENRPGAGNTIGTDYVAKAPPDGYTLLINTNAITTVPSLYPSIRFNVERDFAPITMAASTQNLLAVHPSLPVHSMMQLVALAKAKPGILTMAAAGVGTPSHLAGEMFKQMAGLDIITVQYKGTGASLADLIGGQVAMTFGAMPSLVPLAQSGRLRALGVSGAKRAAIFPNVPTIAETVPGFETEMWFGIFAPAKTPREIVMQLHGEIVRALAHPEMKQRLAADGFEPGGMPPEQLEKLVKSEIERWAKVIRAGNIRAE
jgi:tripartite-type tricarboxylate transporter receptor subunit TctC